MTFSVAEPSQMEAMQARPYFTAALVVFVLSSAVFALLVKRRNGFGILDTALCLLGLKRFQRTAAITLCQALGILVSLGLMLAAVVDSQGLSG